DRCPLAVAVETQPVKQLPGGQLALADLDPQPDLLHGLADPLGRIELGELLRQVGGTHGLAAHHVPRYPDSLAGFAGQQRAPRRPRPAPRRAAPRPGPPAAPRPGRGAGGPGAPAVSVTSSSSSTVLPSRAVAILVSSAPSRAGGSAATSALAACTRNLGLVP